MCDDSPTFCAPDDDYAELPAEDFSSWIPGQSESYVPAADSADSGALASLVPVDAALVIGVWGPSASGKSSAAKRLAAQLFPRAAHIAMDDFAYDSREDIAAAGGDASHAHPFEAPVGYDKEKFMAKLREVAAPGRCVIVEGILLFWWRDIAEMCGIRFEIQASQDVCRERRSKRSLERNPSKYMPERYAPGGWFDSVVWKYYLEYAHTIRSNSLSALGKHYVLNGDSSIEEVEHAALECLKKHANVGYQ